MNTLSLDEIRSWPKAELHVHLDGSLRTSTMVELAMEQGKIDQLPAASSETLARAVREIDNAGSLEAYLAWFDVTLLLMQTEEALQRIASELVEDAAKENVRYLEVRFCPLLHLEEGLTIEEVLVAVIEGLRSAGERFGVETGVIICALREKHVAQSIDLAKLAVEYHGRGVVAFDLAGPEVGNPAKVHLDAFEYARRHLMAITVHAGESWGPSSVHQALLFCGAHRIGHGIAAIEDPALLTYLVNHEIPLEVCPTSNVQTRAAHDFATHPISRLVEAGVRVCINTDSRLFSRETVSEEIWTAHTACGLTASQIRECVRNGFRSAFLPPPRRAFYLAQLEASFS